MMTRAQLFAAAMAQLQASRQRAVTRAEQNRQAAYEKIPRLATLEGLRIETGLKLARLAAAHTQGPALAEARAALGAIETEQAALLRENGLPENWLQPQFGCPHCQDTGSVDGRVCRCVEARIQALRRAELSGAAPLAACRFDNFDLTRYSDRPCPPRQNSDRAIMQANFDYCRQYADGFGPDSPSIFMTGESGLGKTHLALAIAGQLLDAGVDLLYVSSQTAFSQVEQDRFEDGGETLRAMLDAQLLILDDLGTEHLTPYLSSCIYRLVDTRLNTRRPTIYTSNIATQKLLNTRYTDKVGSRLFGDCETLQFVGSDQRLAGQIEG